MDINTVLPEQGEGFVTSNRGPDGKFQFGQQSTIDATIAVGKEWKASHPDQPFSVGHISKKGGGTLPPHASHKLGVDIDIRPLRTDGKNQEVTISQPAFDQASTAELIALWWQKAPVQFILFNDQKVIAAGNSRFFANHHHHFHVRLREKNATIKMGDRGSDVAEVQSFLGIEADGKFGPNTQNAVEAFQADHNLSPDGVVGPKTWAALRAV